MTPARRKVVMIVDNSVDGDSRVQKVARSAAAGGWDVVLVGRSRSGQVETYELGEAQVRRVPVAMTLLGHRLRAPRRRWRWPLAYPHRDEAAYRARRLDALKLRVNERRAAQKLRGASLPQRVLSKLLVLRIRAGVLLHKVRNDQFRRASDSHREPDGRIAQLRARLVTALRPRSAWRRLDPLLEDYPLVYEPLLHELRPDLVHAHDFRMVGIAARVAEQRRSKGHRCAAVYDAHEFLPGVRYRSKGWHLGNEAHEATYAPRCDAVVTVSPRLAQMLQARHGLAELPTVVLNAPALRPGGEAPDGGVRAVCGLADDVPLLVYAGSPSPQRGLATVVHGLTLMPDAHAAMLLPPGKHADDLAKLAAELGVGERLHVLPYVEQDLVVPFLRSADVGLVPIHHHVNHEIALITKYFDYSLAGLPIVTSDVETMGGVTRELGNGEVFVAEDVEDLVRAVRAVLASPQRYRAAYTPEVLDGWTWQAQEKVLLELYDRLVPEGDAA
ncbi:MAG TPA: glycosyltransferase family 4 protein [Mycobacteriales bacterium]|nr:glycosyltransferase family 4 protein [Mycobacteriales bacterium]